MAFLENRNFTFRYFLYFWKLVVYLNEVYFENPETNDCVIWNDLKLCVTFCHFLYFWKLAVYLYEVYFENSKTNDCVTVIISKMRRQKTFWPKARTRKQTFRTVETSSRLKRVHRRTLLEGLCFRGREIPVFFFSISSNIRVGKVLHLSFHM